MDVENRLKSIEGSLLRWKMATVLVLAITFGRMIVGAAYYPLWDKLRVQRLEICDPAGVQVGVVSGEAGYGRLQLMNETDKAEVALISNGNPKIGALASFKNGDGDQAGAVGTSDDGAGICYVNSPKGKLRAALGGALNIGPLAIYDEFGDTRAFITADDASASLVLETHKGKAIVCATASDADGSRIEVKQPGQPLVSHLP